MASDVDICNLALANLGDDATIASIDPPEGSAQAEHCARFYPIARDLVMEAHSWTFTTKRVQGALLTSEASTWQYAYALPADALTIYAVLPNDATDDLAYLPLDAQQLPLQWYVSPTGYTPQNYTLELLSDGTSVIYTNQENAIIWYQARQIDPTKYPVLVVMAIAWQLSAMIAGPMLKGELGAQEAKRCTVMAQQFLAQATAADSNQVRKPVDHVVSWIAGR